VSESVKRMYWFMWNGGDLGGLWKADPKDHSKPGTLLEPGIAYAQVGKWIIGAQLANACSSHGTVWTCLFTRSGGYRGLAVWNSAGTCSGGQCKTTSYYFTGGYVNYRSLDGTTTQISNGSVPIGAKPILLQNQ
jgi:hypothetical protein